MHFTAYRLFRLFVCCALAAFIASSAQAEESLSTARLGKQIENITLKDATGKAHSLYDLKEKKAIVIVFLSFDCPVSTGYSQPLAELAKSYAERGVAFVGVCPGDDDAATVAKHAREFKIPFPVFKDDVPGATAALHAEVTPSAFVLDGQFILRYRGRIDDEYAARLKKKEKITRFDLKEALEDVLAGKAVRQPATQPIGCPIVRGKTNRPGTGNVTFYRDVLPILQNHCQACHRPGEVGPFALMTYRHAANWADDIKTFTQNRQMPPWKPGDGPEFRDSRKLSEKDIATLVAWVDNGTPEGDSKDAPPPRQFPQGWQLGQPDLVLTVPDDFELGPTGRDVFRCFVLPTNLTEDKFVTAVEFRPGNPRVVHHSLNFIDTSGAGRKLEQKEKDRAKKDDEKEKGPGYSVPMGTGFRPSGAIGGWAPGQVARQLPADTAYFLPKGADVVLQVHYHRNGRTEKSRPSIGLYFSPKPVAKKFQSIVVPGRFFFIPAGNNDYTVKGSMWVEDDCTIHSVMPHMHMLGKKVKVTITPPDGPAQTLVEIPDWDYNWQESYFFRQPIAVKAGTRFDIEAHYDNSAKNPRNPNNPPRLVKFGEQTTDEMCFGFIGATADNAGRIRRRTSPPKASQ